MNLRDDYSDKFKAISELYTEKSKIVANRKKLSQEIDSITAQIKNILTKEFNDIIKRRSNTSFNIIITESHINMEVPFRQVGKRKSIDKTINIYLGLTNQILVSKTKIEEMLYNVEYNLRLININFLKNKAILKYSNTHPLIKINTRNKYDW